MAAEFDGSQLSPLWGVPFAGVLLSIALLPLLAPHFWHHHYGKVTAAWALAFLLPFAALFGPAVAGVGFIHALLAEYIPFIVLLVALALFSWASIALGFKCSNLTNRGIVTHGPYAFVRHPAYAAKNLAWWLGALPMLGMMMATGSWKSIGYSLLALFGWTTIYALRAITEERHLLLSNNGYAEYAQKVRWRFVPGIW